MGYYRGYRRYRRRGYGGGGSGNPVVAFVVLIIAGGILSGGKLIGALISLFLFGLVIYGIYRLLKWMVTTPVSVSSKVNFERHTKREFFNGTNDGEYKVADTLACGLDHEKYYIFNNVTIPSQYNGSSQIDHIVVSRLGIFVIETKDYKGWIFGSTEQEKWTQSLPRNNKFPIPNPLRQNWGHIQSLKGIFPTVSEDKFINVVVFTEGSEFKTPMPDNVVNIDGLVPYITKFQNPIIPEEMIYTIVGKLTFRNHTNHISASEHLENLSNHNKN